MLHNKVGERNSYKLFGHFSLTLLACALFSSLSASSFADFRKNQSTAFSNYKEENDRAFVSFLKSDWEAYLLKEPVSRYIKKKPREFYPARSTRVKGQGPKVNIQIAKMQKKSPLSMPVEKMSEEKKDINFDFFGTQISLNIPLGMNQARFYPQTKEGISNYYQTIALSPYESLLEKVKHVSKAHKLNDWGKYMFIHKLSEAIFSNQDESRLLSWFLFNKLGYSVRVGLANSHVIVMHYSKKTIYSTPSYKIANKKFYVLSNYAKGSAGKVFTYKQDYPQANKALDLSMDILPIFTSDKVQKVLHFRQYGEKYNIKYNYNRNLIDFMSTYPQADYETFFNTPIESESYRNIALELKKHINTKQASVALNFVLNFVQSAFKYEVDSQQFGREKVMFAQETLHYDKSDCEDRAILFAYLVKKLFKIGVVGVKYKDHMATALYIPIKGDNVKVHSKKYIIADPTYINASIGQSMPKYRNVRPDSFIKIRENKG